MDRKDLKKKLAILSSDLRTITAYRRHIIAKIRRLQARCEHEWRVRLINHEGEFFNFHDCKWCGKPREV